MIPDNISIQAAQFDDQGKVGKFLCEIFEEELNKNNLKAAENGIPKLNIQDELFAADDFYFSSVELMDCCITAKDQEQIIALCCVNPYVSTLQFIAVETEYRQQGIGSRLLSLGKKVLSKHGCTHLKIELLDNFKNNETIAFFTKNKLNVITSSTLLAGKIF